MYELQFEWSDGELSNDTAEDLSGIIAVLLREKIALEHQHADYVGVELVELVVRKKG